jgi:hypothetical protein
MRVPLLLFLLSIPSLAQDPNGPTVVPFNRADTEHCKVVSVDGKQLLQTVNGGTSVAIELPTTMPDGEFQVYVSVSQIGPGSAEVNPRQFAVYYSDPAHTQFPFYDKAREIGNQDAAARAHRGGSGNAGAQSQGSQALPGTPPPPGSLNSNEWTGKSRTMTGQDPNAIARQQEEARQRNQKIAQSGAGSPAGQSEFLSQTTLQQGSAVSGIVFFKKPKGSKLKVGPQDVLYQIDVPVNGMIFRFK